MNSRKIILSVTEVMRTDAWCLRSSGKDLYCALISDHNSLAFQTGGMVEKNFFYI